MKTTIKFNTGRGYTKNGQRITATLHEDDVVTFHDHDRMVDGEFPLAGYTFGPRTVMHAYDNNESKNTKRSWHDAFLKGGVNSEF